MLKNAFKTQNGILVPNKPIDSPNLLVLDCDTGDLVEYAPVQRVTPKSSKSAEKAMQMARGRKWIVCRIGLRG